MSAAAPPAALADPLLRASLFEDAVGALPPSAFRAAPPRAERIHRGQNRKIVDHGPQNQITSLRVFYVLASFRWIDPLAGPFHL